jgi:hypothetical protein
MLQVMDKHVRKGMGMNQDMDMGKGRLLGGHPMSSGAVLLQNKKWFYPVPDSCEAACPGGEAIYNGQIYGMPEVCLFGGVMLCMLNTDACSGIDVRPDEREEVVNWLVPMCEAEGHPMDQDTDMGEGMFAELYPVPRLCEAACPGGEDIVNHGRVSGGDFFEWHCLWWGVVLCMHDTDACSGANLYPREELSWAYPWCQFAGLPMTSSDALPVEDA